MVITLPIPDDFARRFGSEAEAGRRALEALVLEEYRAGRVSRDELQSLLELGWYEAECFLKDHGVMEGFSFEEIQEQLLIFDRTGE